MTSLPPLIPAALFAALFFWLYAALGRRFLALARLAPSGLRPVEKLLFETTVGIGVIPLLPIGLGICSALSPLHVRIVTLALTLLLAPDLWKVAADLVNLLRRVLSRARSLPVAVWACLLGALLAVLLMHTLFLGFDDDDGYHLAGPWRWLTEGTLSYLPSYTHTNAGLAFEMSYVIALAFNSVLGAKLLHFGAGILSLVATLACARRMSAGWAVGAFVVSLLLIATPLIQVPFLFTVAFADFPVYLSVLVATVLWMAWRETRERKLLWCIALCAGFTASFKFTALAVLGAWALLVALELRAQGKRLVPGFIDLVKFGMLAILPTLPWFARNWYHTGNPLYPMAASLIPSRDWSAEQGAIFGSYIKLYSWGVAAGSNMGEPARKLLLLAAGLGVAAGAALVYWLVRDRRLRLLTCFAAVYILTCIGLTGLVFRYWLPGMVCMLLVVCTAVAEVARRGLARHSWRGNSWRYAPAIVMMLVALGVQARQEMRERTLYRDFRVATGMSTHDRETADDPAEQTWRYIQQNTPPESRFLVAAFYSTFGASSYGCFRAQRHCFTTDSHLQTYINLTGWSAFVSSVQQADVDYVLMTDEQFAPNRQGFDYRARENEYPFCARLAHEAGTLVFQAGHFQVYRIGKLDLAASSP